MSSFLQLHYLTVYPLSNPNRDDLGRPKTAIYGGAPRLRISSQALKRAARLSPTMQTGLEGHLGDRTQRIGEVVRKALAGATESEDYVTEIATKVADVFGKLDAGAAKKGAIRTRAVGLHLSGGTFRSHRTGKKGAGGRETAEGRTTEEDGPARCRRCG